MSHFLLTLQLLYHFNSLRREQEIILAKHKLKHVPIAQVHPQAKTHRLTITIASCPNIILKSLCFLQGAQRYFPFQGYYPLAILYWSVIPQSLR
jgi:hypothetical protein